MEVHMRMRFGAVGLALIGVALIGPAACSPAKIEVSRDKGERVVVSGRGGYTLQVAGAEAEQIYIVTAPDGRIAAARAAGGVSALIGAAEAQNLVVGQQAAMGPGPKDGESDVHIAVPGFSLRVKDGGEKGERSTVKMSAAGFDLDVDADGGGSGERAVVRIGGADAESAREFIDNADGLSADTRAKMREKLGL
jgi:hypothetical protein